MRGPSFLSHSPFGPLRRRHLCRRRAADHRAGCSDDDVGAGDKEDGHGDDGQICVAKEIVRLHRSRRRRGRRRRQLLTAAEWAKGPAVALLGGRGGAGGARLCKPCGGLLADPLRRAAQRRRDEKVDHGLGEPALEQKRRRVGDARGGAALDGLDVPVAHLRSERSARGRGARPQGLGRVV